MRLAARRRARRPALVFATSLLLAALLAVGTGAIVVRSGDLILHTDGDVSPSALPRNRDAPVTLHGFGRFSTASGALPPALKTLDLEFDRHSSVEFEGLPRCSEGKLRATRPAEARRLCPAAIVGTGEGSAIIQFPESAPFKVSSPITFFNARPRHGNPTLISHAYLSVPVPTTYLARLEIERVHNGRYGYRVHASFPPIANGYGVPIRGVLRLGARWSDHGVSRSYLNARCPDGHLQARGSFGFIDGSRLSGIFVKPCSVRAGR